MRNGHSEQPKPYRLDWAVKEHPLERYRFFSVLTYSVHAVRKSDVFRTLGSANSASWDQQLTAVLAERFFERVWIRPQFISESCRTGSFVLPEKSGRSGL
jgi:hypothetical protein